MRLPGSSPQGLVCEILLKETPQDLTKRLESERGMRQMLVFMYLPFWNIVEGDSFVFHLGLPRSNVVRGFVYTGDQKP